MIAACISLAAVSCGRKQEAKPAPPPAESNVKPAVEPETPDQQVKKAGKVVQMTHNRRTSTLVIQFDSGECLAYEDVPESLYMDLVRAASAQKFFDDNIKDRFVSHPGTMEKPRRPEQTK